MKPQSKSFIVFAVAVPVAFAVIAAGAVLLPRLFGKPPVYDFVYAAGIPPYGSYGKYDLVVTNGRVTLVNRDCPSSCSPSDTRPVLYRYDVTTQHGVEISLEQAQELTLDPSERSPDGYRLTRGDAHGGIFPLYIEGFGNRPMYLVGPGGRYEVNLAQSGSAMGGSYYYSSYNTRLLGWIKKGDA